jgi:thiamine-monophosphate kinase
MSAVIDLPAIPLSKATSAVLAGGAVSMDAILSGGDDYEILCAVPQGAFGEFMQATGEVGVAASPIGTIMAGTSSPKFLDAEGRELPLRRTSYSHF